MECPRCNSKLPDNLKYCGFCGIEIATGRQNVPDSWSEYARTIMDQNVQAISVNINRVMVGIAVLLGSLVALASVVGDYPFLKPILIGLAFALFIVVLLFIIGSTITIREGSIVNMILGATYVKILKGELKTTQEIFNFLSESQKKWEKKLWFVNLRWETFAEVMTRDGLNER
jgi:hypothetical protein